MIPYEQLVQMSLEVSNGKPYTFKGMEAVKMYGRIEAEVALARSVGMATEIPGEIPSAHNPVEPKSARILRVKYNQNHDEQGRFASSDSSGGGSSTAGADGAGNTTLSTPGGVLASRAGHLADRVVSKGGFSAFVDLRSVPQKGFFVSVSGHTKEIPVDQLTGKSIGEYRKANLTSLLADQQLRIGGWHNSDNHHVYLDLSKAFSTKAAATAFGRAHNQIAGWDMAKQKEFPLGGTGKGVTKAQKDATSDGTMASSTPIKNSAGLTYEQECARLRAMFSKDNVVEVGKEWLTAPDPTDAEYAAADKKFNLPRKSA